MSDDKTINQLKQLGNSVLPTEPTDSPVINKPLHDKMGKLTPFGFSVLMASANDPANHFTVDLGINAFKQYVRSVPGITKSMINDQVRRYKSKAWGEYKELVNHKGTFPTHKELLCQQTV